MFHTFEDSRQNAPKPPPLNIVVFETQEATPHLETTFEITQRHLNHGDKVTLCFWNAVLPYCEPWGPYHDSAGKGAAFRRGLNLLTSTQGQLTVIDTLPRAFQHSVDIEPLITCDSIHQSEELRQLKWMGQDAGEAALSSLITRIRLPYFDISQYKRLTNDALQTFCLTYLSAKCVLSQQEFDIAYVFNGRFAATRGILRAMQETNCQIRVHERASSNQKYSLYTAPVHHRSYFQECVRDFWQKSPIPLKRKMQIAESFFLDRANGLSKDWPSFTSHQNMRIETTNHKHRKLIAYFSSSDDEQLAAGEAFEQRGYSTQEIAVRDLCQIAKQSTDIHLVIRAHPHLRLKPADSWKYLFNYIDSENVELIPPDSPINSYSVLKASDLVLSYGSTMGVEANFYRKPCAILGSSYYDDLNVSDKLFDREKLLTYLSRRDWKPHPQDGAIMYGYFWADHGIKYQYYQPIDFFSGKFRGESLFEQQQMQAEHAIPLKNNNQSSLLTRIRTILKRSMK